MRHLAKLSIKKEAFSVTELEEDIGMGMSLHLFIRHTFVVSAHFQVNSSGD